MLEPITVNYKREGKPRPTSPETLPAQYRRLLPASHARCADTGERDPRYHKNRNLRDAKQKKYDEFYTHLEDIERELPYYQPHFQNTIVYCNCDNPGQSAFWNYFHRNFAALGLKKLTATYYQETGSVYASEYLGGADQDVSVYTSKKLCGNGDFRSKECLMFLQEADIVVTNVPFSLFRDFIQLMAQQEKQFLVIGNRNLVTSKGIFPLFQRGQIRFGYHKVKSFLRPDGKEQTFGNIGWFTNLNVTKQQKRLPLTKSYTPDAYPRYCNCDAINVDRIKDIPRDYDGAMGVPISFLDVYDPGQFTILGRSVKSNDNKIPIHHITKEWLDLYKQQGGKGHYTESMHSLVYIKDGLAIAPYARILIQKKETLSCKT